MEKCIQSLCREPYGVMGTSGVVFFGISMVGCEKLRNPSMMRKVLSLPQAVGRVVQFEEFEMVCDRYC